MFQRFTCLSESLHARMISAVGITANLKRLLEQPKYRRQQGELAKRIGATPTQLSDWKSGRYTDLRISNLMALAKEFGVSVEDIIKGEDAEYDRLMKVAFTRREKVRNSLPSDLPSSVQGSTATSDSGGSGEYSAPASQAVSPLEIAAEITSLVAHLRRLADTLVVLGGHSAGARADEARLSTSAERLRQNTAGTSSPRGRR